ncbi:hypothetical protein CRG98_029854 [Punica granatum]|uniref:Uncharacterized protein n=1 Tax=Punica granatum TaxID=22663 RepID=A0A2I0J164_PUNGR|nr:hypothetical protein CRG98_029854 [Punica granatum]
MAKRSLHTNKVVVTMELAISVYCNKGSGFPAELLSCSWCPSLKSSSKPRAQFAVVTAPRRHLLTEAAACFFHGLQLPLLPPSRMCFGDGRFIRGSICRRFEAHEVLSTLTQEKYNISSLVA